MNATYIRNNKPLIRLVLVSLLMLILPTQLCAQSNQIRFEHIHQGLSQVTINTMLQDQQGFLWFGTQDGLNRYDGYRFKVFKHIPGKPNSLVNNHIQSLYQDKQGLLWIGTQGGLSQFNPKTGNFTRFVHQPNNPQSLSHNNVLSIIAANNEALWIGTSAGLNLFDQTQQTFSHFINDPQQQTSLSDDNVNVVYRDSLGTLWVGTNNGLNEFDRKHQAFNQPSIPGDHIPLLENHQVFTVFEDTQATLWIGTDQGLHQYSPNQNNAKNKLTTYKHDAQNPASISHDHIRAITQDNSGALWVGTNAQGLNKLLPGSEQFIRYSHNPANPNSLSNDFVISMLQDHSGVLWFGTFGGALNKYYPSGDYFHSYRHDPTDKQSLSSAHVRAITQDTNGMLWLGTMETGLNKLDLKNNQFTHYPLNENEHLSLSSPHVTTIFEQRPNRLWVGTFGGGLNHLNPNTGRFEQFQHAIGDPNSLSDNVVRAIKQDSLGHLWIATYNGLNKWLPSSKTFTRYMGELARHKIYSLHIDDNDMMWIGTLNGGLLRFEPHRDTFKRYVHNPQDPTSISNNDILSIYAQGDHTLWLGTYGGLNKFDINTQSFTAYRQKDGLPNDTVYGILPGQQNHLWLSTNKGISRFDSKNQTFKNFDRSDGLNDNEFNGGAYNKNHDNQLLFGGLNGVSAFYPSNIKNDTVVPKVVITRFLQFNQAKPLAKPISQTRQLTLNNEVSVFSFEFSALHYGTPLKNRYQYKLDGFNQQWIETGALNRRATYTNLDSGEYLFRVKGSNKDKRWGPETTIKLTILPAIWHTWWAKLLYLLVAMALFGAIFQQRYYKHQALVLAKNNAEQARINAELAQHNAEKADKAKSLFVADVSHEIRTPLNAVLGYTQILEREPLLDPQHKRYVKTIEKSGDHLLSLINNILDISKIEANAMALTNEDFELVELVEGIGTMLSDRCEQKGLQWHFANQCDERIAVNGDHGKIRQVLINLLGNAVKFTHQGTITLNLSSTATDHYRFSVVDTGVGIESQHQQKIFEAFGQTEEGVKQGGTGLGLAIAQRQVSLMGGQLELTSACGTGSSFCFTLHLPPSKQPIEPRHNRRAHATKLAGGVSLCALVVDDTNENRKLLVRVLRQVGVSVFEAENGQQALEMLHGADPFPDLIFMDIRMPIMQGVETLQSIRRDFKEKSPMCIVMTANAMVEDVERYLKAGFDHYISYPFRFEAIYESIHQLLDVEFEYRYDLIESEKTHQSQQVNGTQANPQSQGQTQPSQSHPMPQLNIPPMLYQTIHDAAGDYEIAKLEESLDELANLSPAGQQLATQLKQYLANYNMVELTRNLDKAVGSNKSEDSNE